MRTCAPALRGTLVSDELWDAIEPGLPPPRRWGGHPRIPDRAALAGIVYVLRHGLRWRDLPPELGCGSGVTCWRRLRQWQTLGVWAAVHRTLLNWLGLLAFRQLTVRYARCARYAHSVVAFLHVAFALVCLRFLRRAEGG